MRTLSIGKVLVLFFVCCANAFGYDEQKDRATISASQADRLRHKLAQYEKGELTWEQLMKLEGIDNDLIAFSFSYSNEITATMKLPIARGYAAYANFRMAAKFSTEYLNVYSNDWKGWSILCGAYIALKKPDQALAAGTNVIRLGSDANVAAIGITALQTKRVDVFESMICDRLLVLKDDSSTKPAARLDMIKALLIYSLLRGNEVMFQRALENVRRADVTKDLEVVDLIRDGCKAFKSSISEGLCHKLGEGNSALNDQ